MLIDFSHQLPECIAGRAVTGENLHRLGLQGFLSNAGMLQKPVHIVLASTKGFMDKFTGMKEQKSKFITFTFNRKGKKKELEVDVVESEDSKDAKSPLFSK